MKKKRWVDTLVVLALIIITCVIRIVYVNFYLDEISVSGDLMKQVWTADGNPLALFSPDFDGIYAVVLSVAVGLFGNKAIVGVGINIFLQVINLLMIYLCIRMVSDIIAATIPTLIISAIPVYFTTIKNISSFQIFNIVITGCILLLVICFRLVVWGIKSIVTRNNYDKYDDTEFNDQDEWECDYFPDDEQTVRTDGYEEKSDFEDTDFNEDEEYSEEDQQPYQDDVWNNQSSITAPFSEMELDALASLDKQKNCDIKGEKQMEGHLQEEMKQAKQLAPENHITSNNQNDKSVQNQEYKEVEQKQMVESKNNKWNQLKPEINFDFNPRNEFMHYDLEDMSGMDFFDIE